MPSGYGHLTLQQANQLARSIEMQGFRTEEFRWSPDDWPEADFPPKVTHIMSGRFFSIARYAAPDYPRPYFIRYAPAFEKDVQTVFKLPWTSVHAEFLKWATYLYEELIVGDRWSQSEGALLVPGTEHENTRFSTEEVRRVQESLDQFVGEVEKQSILVGQQLLVFKATVDHYKDAATTLGRVNWRDAFAGALLGHAVTSALTMENARLLVKLATDALGWLVTHLPQLPSGTP